MADSYSREWAAFFATNSNNPFSCFLFIENRDGLLSSSRIMRRIFHTRLEGWAFLWGCLKIQGDIYGTCIMQRTKHHRTPAIYVYKHVNQPCFSSICKLRPTGFWYQPRIGGLETSCGPGLHVSEDVGPWSLDSGCKRPNI